MSDENFQQFFFWRSGIRILLKIRESCSLIVMIRNIYGLKVVYKIYIKTLIISYAERKIFREIFLE